MTVEYDQVPGGESIAFTTIRSDGRPNREPTTEPAEAGLDFGIRFWVRPGPVDTTVTTNTAASAGCADGEPLVTGYGPVHITRADSERFAGAFALTLEPGGGGTNPGSGRRFRLLGAFDAPVSQTP